jgi:DNA-binding transcriptional ArsR family regulator
VTHRRSGGRRGGAVRRRRRASGFLGGRGACFTSRVTSKGRSSRGEPWPPRNPDEAALATERLLKLLQHPLRRELLRRYVEATGALNPRDLALLLGEPLSTISYNVRELERAGAIAFAKEGNQPGWVADFYEATWWVRLSPEIVAALGFNPEEQVRLGRQRLDDHIAERREDKAFMTRLKQRGEEDRELLDRLRDSDA